MTELEPLAPDLLRRRSDPDALGFESTAELDEPVSCLGQERAVDALRLGVELRAPGFNIFVIGEAGLGRHTIARTLVEERASGGPRAPDWCYVHDFDDAQTPNALRLPNGEGPRLDREVSELIEELVTAIPAALDSDEHHARVHEAEHRFQRAQNADFEDLRKRAETESVSFLQTPAGFVFGPMRDGEVLSNEQFMKLPEEEREAIQKKIAELQQGLREILKRMPRRQKELRDRVRELIREATRAVVDPLFEELVQARSDLPDVVAYLERWKEDLMQNAGLFQQPDDGPDGVGREEVLEAARKRYGVNVLVTNADVEGAPVVYVDNPTLPNLVGRVEYLATMGTLITDFHMIRAGGLHRANGGYLLLDAERVLMHPFAWNGLKRALRAGEIRIESLAEAYSATSTVSLEPEPIPLDVKVVLIGDRRLYYLLSAWDPDLAQLFKVPADLEEVVVRDAGREHAFARMLATLAREHELPPLAAAAVAGVVEWSAREASDSERLSAHVGGLVELITEAAHYARGAGAERIDLEHVERAIAERERRVGRIRDRMREAVQRGTVLIDTEGTRVGQVNGLSVLIVGALSFGQPSRITATARLGNGRVVDIEREVELGGAIHSKGVLILSSFLAHRFAGERPLSLAASLVFEQSYGRVDGDSASVAELCALLSAIAEVPLRQDLAVTGAVNQHGQVQAIGGVNEKIEGFFDVCAARGLSGTQGVVIPVSNVQHLMLRPDVVEAVREGRFRVYAVEDVDQVVALLTGLEAGQADERGHFPAESLNGRVAKRLVELERAGRRFARARRGAPSSVEPAAGAGDDDDDG